MHCLGERLSEPVHAEGAGIPVNSQVKDEQRDTGYVSGSSRTGHQIGPPPDVPETETSVSAAPERQSRAHSLTGRVHVTGRARGPKLVLGRAPGVSHTRPPFIARDNLAIAKTAGIDIQSSDSRASRT